MQDHSIPEPDNPDPGTPVNNEFKVSTTGVKQEGDKLYLQGNVDQVDASYKDNGTVGFLVSSRVTSDGPINPDPQFNNDPNIRFYKVKYFGKDLDENNSFTPLETGLTSILEPFAFTEQYFRTVIILKNNKIIYGNVIHRSGLPLPAKPSPWEISTQEYGVDGLNLSITKQGQIPAIEFGFVVSYKQKESDKINNLPTVSDEKLDINDWKDQENFGEYIKAGPLGSRAFHNVNFNFQEMYYRAYLILQDESIVYGNVMHVKK
ncbi:hypothetical protein GCM10011325_23460 [Dyadobacter sediminis]|nr:hypothetical protein GCM10011325_23460 [Dyadobacter sediminis]